MAQNDGYDRSKIIGGFKGEPIKSSMLGKNLKSRGLISNNLSFRQAEGLAPYNEYGFLFPTGTEKGAVWRFSQSGEQYQDTLGSRVTAVGQSIALQLNSKITPIKHSLNLNDYVVSYNGDAATTTQYGANVVSFNAASGGITFSNVYSAAEQLGRVEATFLVEGPIGASFNFGVGGGNTSILPIPASGKLLVTVGNNAAGGSFIQLFAQTQPLTCKVTVLDITGYPGNHLFQSTATARPLTAIESIGGWNQSVYSGRFDIIDDTLATAAFAAGTFGASMDVFMPVKRTGNFNMLWGDVSTFFLGNASTNVTSATAGFGSPSYNVNGVAVPGGTAVTEAQFNAAVPFGTWAVVEALGVNMASLTTLHLNGLPGGSYNNIGNVGDIVICPAQPTANRNLTRTLVGASVGLNL